MKPVIGIGCDVGPSGGRDHAFVFMTYVQAVIRAGALPLLVPPQPENVADLLELLDGVLLAGGEDCDPAVYGEARHPSVEPMDERRQANDLALARAAVDNNIPVLGVCLGMQLLNVVRGGTLIQDIATESATAIDHASEPLERIRHDVEVVAGTRIASIIGAGVKNVNSSHHQAVRRLGQNLRITASAPDGIIEAFEDEQSSFLIGVQWHPEDMPGEESATQLFEAFVAAARAYAERKRGVLV